MSKDKKILALSAMAVLIIGASVFFLKKRQPAKEVAEETGLSRCLELTEKNANKSCLINLFYYKYDKARCLDLAPESVRLFCLDTVNNKKAADSDDIGLCQEVSEENQKGCYFSIMGEKNGLEFCEKIPDKYREDCVNQLNDKTAVINLDESMCQKITAVGGREDCLYKVRSLLKNKK